MFALACSGCTWPMFGFDAAHTRFDPRGVGMSTSNVESMVLKGTGFTGGGVESSPAVSIVNANGQGTILVFVGSIDGKLYAFDELGSSDCTGTPLSCTPLWTFTTGNAVFSSPAV